MADDPYADDPLVVDTEDLVRRLHDAGDDQLLGNIARRAIYALSDQDARVDAFAKTFRDHPDEAARAQHAPGRGRDVVRALRAEEKLLDLEAYDLARQRQRAKDRVDPPELVSLDAFLARPREPVAYRFDGLWPTGGRVLVTAQKKTGKTTLVANVLRSLVDGDDFLGRHKVDPVDNVVLVDNEMSVNQLHEWLGAQGIREACRVRVQPLRGAVSSFDILDPAVRKEWAAKFRGADVVVFDCLRPALDALGIDEDKDAGRFLVALDALCFEAGVAELVVIHHMGHNNERSRGSSRIEDWPDAIWRLVKADPRDDSPEHTWPRYFSAFGRDVGVDEARLSYDPITRTYDVAEGAPTRAQAKAQGVEDGVLAYVAENPGCSGRQMEGQVDGVAGVGGAATDIRAARKSLCERGLLRTEPGPRGAKLHFVAEGDDPDFV